MIISFGEIPGGTIIHNIVKALRTKWQIPFQKCSAFSSLINPSLEWSSAKCSYCFWKYFWHLNLDISKPKQFQSVHILESAAFLSNEFMQVVCKNIISRQILINNVNEWEVLGESIYFKLFEEFFCMYEMLYLWVYLLLLVFHLEYFIGSYSSSEFGNYGKKKNRDFY